MRRSAPSTLRNREPIAGVLRDWLPDSGEVLELASGTGEHVVHFARRFPRLQWQPSDVDPRAIESVSAWSKHASLTNVSEPILLDAAAEWPGRQWSAILCINMAHISPWRATFGVMEGAATHLMPGGSLIFYGPWIAADTPTAPSNLAFDADLKARNPEWGIRTLEALESVAATYGLEMFERRAMPANNFMLLLRRLSERR